MPDATNRNPPALPLIPSQHKANAASPKAPYTIKSMTANSTIAAQTSSRGLTSCAMSQEPANAPAMIGVQQIAMSHHLPLNRRVRQDLSTTIIVGNTATMASKKILNVIISYRWCWMVNHPMKAVTAITAMPIHE